MNGGTASFSGSLRNVCNLADLKLKRLLNTIDQWAGVDDGPRPEPTRVDDHPRVLIDLVAEGFDTVLWATGFRADYSWLNVPVSIARARSATTAAWSATRPGSTGSG